MRVRIEVEGRCFGVGLERPLDLSIPLDFGGPQPEAFFLPAASAAAFEAGGFVGDTRRGGSANCAVIQMAPHGNGTHTECVGHILDERVSVAEALAPGWVPATVVTVAPEALGASGEGYVAAGRGGDQVVTARALSRALEAVDGGGGSGWRRALVVRTGGGEKGSRRYSGANPAYFTLEAMALVRSLGVEHLLVELPSVDREEDGGALAAHHLFWGVPQGSRALAGPRPGWTITEMINVGAEVLDGQYVLELQIPPFVLDAAPSRPILYAVKEEA